MQCGIQVTQKEDFSIELGQEHSITEITEIVISRDRSRHPDLPTTEHEKSELRGVLGSLSWICGQTNFMRSVDVNFLITKVPNSTVQEILEVNKLVRAIQKWKHHRLKIHSFEKDAVLEMTCWSDAGWANRPNGKDSTEGIFVSMSTSKLREGHETGVTPISWRSGKLERVCRSPAAAETIAARDGEDELFFLRVLWGEMRGYPLELRRPEITVAKTPGHLITDAKNLFDKLHAPILTIKGAEKRSDIEALSLREHLEKGETTISWVHGDAMLANSLTKPHEKHQVLLFVQMGHRWKVVYDENMKSARARKKEGLSAMDSEDKPNHEYNHSVYQRLTPIVPYQRNLLPRNNVLIE